MDNCNEDIKLGPLTGLIGVWKGNSGMDVAPERDGPDENPYYETIEFSLVNGVVENAEEQELAAVHYRQTVRRKSNDKVFHDQTGYWMWDADKEMVMHSFVIPRGVSVLAAGGYSYTTGPDEEVILSVSAGDKNPDWKIAQSPFMEQKAKTTAFELKITLKGDLLAYFQNTTVDIYNRIFDHTDENTLRRV